MAQRPTTMAVPAGTDLDPSHPLSISTFRSIIPNVDAILEILLEQGTSDSPPGNVEASAQVAQQARELANALEEMRKATLSLPGGAYSTEAIERMTGILQAEAEKRRAVLRAFGERNMPSTASAALERRSGEESVMPSPATRLANEDEA